MVSTDVTGTNTNSPPIGSIPREMGIEEDMLPKKYQRKPLTTFEMETIEVLILSFKSTVFSINLTSSFCNFSQKYFFLFPERWSKSLILTKY